MPIYDQSYRPWTGELAPHPKTWWVIAKTGVQLLWKKWMILLLLGATIPFFVKAVQIYLVTRLQGNAIADELAKHFQVNAQFFEDFFKGQGFFLLIVIVLAGSGLIANDKRVKALQIYFSKPVSFLDYIIGKWCIIAFYGSLITIIPALLLFVLRILFAADSRFFAQYYWLPFSILGYGCVLLLVMGGLMLAFSALSPSGRNAAILFFVTLSFTEIIRAVFSQIPTVGTVSLQADLRQIAAFLFQSSPPFEFSIFLAAVMLVLVVAFSVLTLKLKIKPTEVVR